MSGPGPLGSDGPVRSLFVSHGPPTLPLIDCPARDFLGQLFTVVPKPRAIIAVSAHWIHDRPAVGAAARPDTIHDFGGFPAELYRLRHPCPGDPALAARVARLIGGELIDDQGLDHGVWVPLRLADPQATIPVVPVALVDGWGPAEHLDLGRKLAPLAADNVLVLGTGSATHNLRAFMPYIGRPAAAPPPWVADFAAWLGQRVETGDTAALVDYRRQAPHAVENHPSEEHLLPLHVALGAATGPGRVLHDSFLHGVLSMATYAWP